MRSNSIEINVSNFTVPMKSFCDNNGFDYEYYASKNCVTMWIHNNNVGFQHFNNFNKGIYQFIALFSDFKNKLKNNSDIELYAEVLENEDFEYNGKKYKMKTFEEVPGLIISNLKRLDEIYSQ